MKKVRHPLNPSSNVAKFSDYDPAKYTITDVSRTVTTNEALLPGCPPNLTQQTIAKCLAPLTRDLCEVPARRTINELPDAVIEQMVRRDKAFWVDKPGVNDYTIHDSYRDYGMCSEVIKPGDSQNVFVGETTTPEILHQDPFPRSYQYDLDCVQYRRTHACDGLALKKGEQKKPLGAHCRDCQDLNTPGLTPFQLAWVKDPGQKRWKYYPDLTATLTHEEIRASMDDVGRPFQNEACNWYYHNYPPVKYDCIIRKFSK